MGFKTTLGAAALSFAAVVATGCSAADPADSPSQANAQPSSIDADTPQELAEFIRATVHYDFEPAPNPGVLRTHSDIVLLGKVASVEDVLLQTDAENIGGVLISLTVDEMWKDDPARQSDVVTLVIPRPTNIDVSLYREALPAGSRVALFGSHTMHTLLTEPTDVVYDPAPQGLIFESAPGHAVNVWGDEVRASGWRNVTSMEELRKATLAS